MIDKKMILIGTVVIGLIVAMTFFTKQLNSSQDKASEILHEAVVLETTVKEREIKTLEDTLNALIKDSNITDTVIKEEDKRVEEIETNSTSLNLQELSELLNSENFRKVKQKVKEGDY